MNYFVQLFLQKIHAMIRNKRRHFVRRTYPDGVDYLEHLAKIGIESIDQAWEYILQLDVSNYFEGPEKDETGRTKSDDLVVWTFKMEIEGMLVYIKLKDEEDRRGCVCLSFHKDVPPRAH